MGHKPLARKTGGSYYYYIYNAHGDVTALTDESGNIVNSYTYDAWGNILSQTETVDNPRNYAGEYYDDELNMYYLRARYYDPAIGRFTSYDVEEGNIAEPLDMNRYVYCRNNPVKFVDPTGKTWEYFDMYLPQWAQDHLARLTNSYYAVGDSINEYGGLVKNDIRGEVVTFRMQFLDSKYLSQAVNDLQRVGLSVYEPNYYQRIYEWAMALQETEREVGEIPRNSKGNMNKRLFNALLGGVKADLKQFNDACRKLGINGNQKYDFQRYLEDYKSGHGMPAGQTLPYKKLIEIGNEFLGN